MCYLHLSCHCFCFMKKCLQYLLKYPTHSVYYIGKSSHCQVQPQAQKTLSRHQKPGAGKSFICPVDLYTSVRQTGRFLLLIPIVIYSLNVIILIKKIKCLLDVFDILFFCKINICLRNHCNFSRNHRDSGFFHLQTNITEVFR